MQKAFFICLATCQTATLTQYTVQPAMERVFGCLRRLLRGADDAELFVYMDCYVLYHRQCLYQICDGRLETLSSGRPLALCGGQAIRVRRAAAPLSLDEFARRAAQGRGEAGAAPDAPAQGAAPGPGEAPGDDEGPAPALPPELAASVNADAARRVLGSPENAGAVERYRAQLRRQRALLLSAAPDTSRASEDAPAVEVGGRWGP